MSDVEMGQSTEKARVKILNPDELDGWFLTASGVRVATIGEDGDVLLLGHHDDRAAWSLFADFRSRYDGEELSWEDMEVHDIERKYASFSDHSEGCCLMDCDCEADDVCGPCLAKNHDGCESPCLCADDYEHDRPSEWPCSCECYCDEYAWWVDTTKSGHEVTWVRFSYAKDAERRKRHMPPGLPTQPTDAPDASEA